MRRVFKEVLSIVDEAARVSRRTLTRILRNGPYARPLDFMRDRMVLLFYEDFESDSFFRHDRHLRRAVRRLVRAGLGRPQLSGFAVAFRALVRALEMAGYRVVINDSALARQNPRYPIGILGYPHVLRDFDLPNPAVLGPGLYDHPLLAPRLMEDPRFRAYIVSSEWMRGVFAPIYGEKCVRWYAAVDLDRWQETTDRKETDFIVYVKFLWDRDRSEVEMLQPILSCLELRGLTTAVIRYGDYDQEQYRQLLHRVRGGMIFLCEHETQGIAYQEALASGIPILAWDQGVWLDKRYTAFSAGPIPASSVPYFSPECGERFRDLAEFESALARFLTRLPEYRPREYVARELSVQESARIYVAAYAQAGGFHTLPTSRRQEVISAL
jgi:hypothetical protein